MMRRPTATVLVIAMMLQMVLPALGQIGSPPPPPPADVVSEGVDLGSLLGSPALFFLLRTDEERHPERVFLRVDDMRFQTNVDTSGSLTKVAQYRPLDTGVKVKNLVYQRDYATQVFQMLGDYEGYSSSRLEASLNAPSRYHVKVTDYNVYHRLENPTKIDFTLTPDARYERTWQRVKADGDVALSKGGEVSAYGGIQVDTRQGVQGHTFFQLHRFNCTDCHTLGYGRSVSYRTEDWYAGGRGKLPWQGAVVDARFRSSRFDNQGPSYRYFFGGPYGNSTLHPTSSSRDTTGEYQAYVGKGDGPWRAGAHVTTLDRRNSVTGQTRNANYVSVQAGGRVGTDLSLTGSYYAQTENHSLSSILSNSKQRLLFQGTWTPLKTLGVTGRLGLEDRQYKVNGFTAPEMHDTWFELRSDWRPTRNWQLQARYRNDNVDRPYFPTDLARRSLLEAKATYSTSEVTAGLVWSQLYGSNTINDFRQADFLAFVTARVAQRYLINATFVDTSVNSNVAQNFFLPMPEATAAAISPGIGGPMFLQSGLPYSGHNQYFQAGLTIPLGVKYPIHLTPTYRWVRTDTSANYLPIFPAVPLDSQVHIVQSIYGVRLDAPVWGPNDRLGVGWEHNRWKDGANPNRTGTFDLFMINFSKRY